ncbi:Hypothetical predicted protein [Paramuricea clavata]|uniref:Uncharacterized protein n=1 Tax=Paramuricea clavata TaxID=317549 RepID=A0A6S7JYJ7_PARCT|nr:Hypothetical predicted protein [Paramuricea clavata]
MPEPGARVEFKNYMNTLFAPFVIYGDLECILVPTEVKAGKNTRIIQKHKVIKYGYKRICRENSFLTGEYQTYTGEDAISKLLTNLKKEQKDCNKLARQFFNKNGEMEDEDILHYREQTNCYICHKLIGIKDKSPYFHRINLNYLGAAHEKCKFKSFKIPIVFHNLRGYDSHPIIIEACNQKIEPNVIATNLQKYLSFSFGQQLIFIDSFQFMSTSLEKLVSNLKGKTSIDELHTKFPITVKRFSGEALYLVTQKGVFPYDYFDSPQKLDETSLPPKEAFYSTLYKSHISDNDYQRALKVWDHFKMKTFRDYLDLYQETDVLLLADTFENFRSTSHNTYGLDPANYISNPSLTWDAMLKDRDEKGWISHKYGKSNNKFTKDYNPEEESTFIKDWDMNNLYGWCMSQYLPSGNFKWEEDLESLNYKDFLGDSPRGLVLEVDLEYPSELHNLHKDYPLAPHKMKVSEDMISPYNKKIRDKLGLSTSEVEKLLTTLYDKKEYVLHVRNLDYYLSLGMKLTKIHRAISFDQ